MYFLPGFVIYERFYFQKNAAHLRPEVVTKFLDDWKRDHHS